jgi:glycosyltransferase involved in cell wall biosynthesis
VKFASAIEKIVAGDPNVRFTVVGGVLDKERNILYGQNGELIPSDDMRAVMAQLVNTPSVRDRVSFIHEVTNADYKQELFSNADIFVLPSYSEGCPIAVMEAMASGLPLVVTPVGALPEILKEGTHCLFAEIGNAHSLAEKILCLAKDAALREAMGAANQELIRTRYTPEHIIPAFEKMFKEVLAKGN